MCVEPSYQRQGVGSTLIQLGFDQARAEGLPLTVTAEAPAYGFSDALGFKETKHVDIDLRQYAPANSGFGIFRLRSLKRSFTCALLFDHSTSSVI
jgi:predicted N-acetyltransferase YhbS